MNRPWNVLRRVFRLPHTPRRIREDLDEELRFHLEGRVEDLIEREHLSRADAEREATRRFGDYDAYRQEVRSIDVVMLERRNRMERFDTVKREMRRAARTLARTPWFSLIVIVTLALGLGASTTIFTLLDRVVLRPMPYANADRLVHIGTLWPKLEADKKYGVSRGQFFYFRQHSSALQNLAIYSGGMTPVFGEGDRPSERVPIVEASATVFDVLGIVPLIGRPFTADEGLARVPSVALLAHDYWQRRFGGDTRIAGKRLQIGDRSIEIIGVLPPGANVPEFKADLWVPKHLDPGTRVINNHTHLGIGVLKPGVTLEAAAADIKRLQDRFAAEHPTVYSKTFVERVGFSMNVTWLRDAVVGGATARTLWTLFASVAFVLLIAAANVANLFLVRIDARRREVAVRTALGAGRSQLAVHYLTESILISLASVAAALALGYGLLHVVLALAPQSLPRLDEVTFDVRSVLFCITAALAFGVTFGLLPLASANLDLAMLRDGGRGLTPSRPRELARRGLVITQVALAVVLLSGAGLMVKSFVRLRSVKPGFDPVGVLAFSLTLPDGRYKTGEQQTTLWKEIAEQVEALPGVKRAGLVSDLPLAGVMGCTAIGTDATALERGQCMPLATVSPGYFETMGIAVDGVLPTWSRVQLLEGPVVLSKSFAKRFWPGESAIGHTVQPLMTDKIPPLPIVGLADDVRADGLHKPPVQIAYLPLMGRNGAAWWETGNQMTLVVRAPSVDSRTLTTAVHQVVARIDPQVPIADTGTLELVIAKSMAQTSFMMLLLLISATIALSLSAVGIYGVIGYIVSQRRSEIGIRMALGAQLAAVARMVVTQSVTLATLGILIGVVAALAATRVLASMLFEVTPTDPMAMVGTCVVLWLVSVLASAGPAWRAASVDPVEALKSS